MSGQAHSSVGSRIRLISNSQIRYEGMLHSIDAEDNTVSLTNVRIFGTEGRRNSVDEVPPSDQLFDIIVFRGSDIYDLTLFEKNEALSAAADPAILSATPARGGGAVRPNRPFGTSAQNTGAGGFYDAVPAKVSRPPRRGGYGGATYHNHSHGGGGGGGGQRYNRGGYGGGGRGAGSYHHRQEGHTGQDFRPATGAAKEEFKEDFDFHKSREEFEKKKNEFEKAKEDAKSQPKAYIKNTFFDTISCDQKERNQGRRMDREEMKKADTETFGSEMVGNMRGFRRGRGGRGRFQRY